VVLTQTIQLGVHPAKHLFFDIVSLYGQPLQLVAANGKFIAFKKKDQLDHLIYFCE